MKIGFENLYKINKVLKKYGKEVEKIFKPYRKDIEKLGIESFKTIETKCDQAIKILKEKADGFDRTIKECGGIENLLRLLWSTEEETSEVLSLETIISWCKENLPQTAKAAAILRLSPEKFPIDSEEKYNFCCLACFLDANDDIIDNFKMKYFYANSMDIRLEDSFGDKDMVILK